MWPTLAIVIITYNRRDVLRETLHRLQQHLHYTGPRTLIVADDGSDDGTADRAEAAGADRVLRERPNRGKGAAASSTTTASLGTSVCSAMAAHTARSLRAQ